MNYSHFSEEDFASDDYFQRWVIQKDAESDLFWQNWLIQHPEKKPIVAKARWILENLSFNERWSSAERKAMWQVISENLEPKQPETNVIPLNSANSRNLLARNKWYWMTAASVAVLLLSFGLIYLQTRPNEIATKFGEMRSITLADGSVVTLNANSSLRYSKDFLEKPVREIWVDGEAFFEVTKRTVKSKRVPFLVHANNLTIQVLGTAFNVINRRGKVDVVLEHGSVKVVDEKNEQNTVLLKPGEKASQVREAATLYKQPIQVEQYTSWKNRVILFKQKSLPELAEMMKDLYDIDLIIDNPALKQETFTGSFPTDSAGVFFDKLQKMYPIEIHKDGNSYHLK